MLKQNESENEEIISSMLYVNMYFLTHSFISCFFFISQEIIRGNWSHLFRMIKLQSVRRSSQYQIQLARPFIALRYDEHLNAQMDSTLCTEIIS